MSAEARSASAYLAGCEPPPVPEGFSPEAAKIWRDVVSAKPVDWFDGGSLSLLSQYCRTMAQAERVAAELDSPMASEFSDVEREVRERRLVNLNGNCTTLATKLRITVQMKVHSESGMLSEKNKNKRDDNILGGKAVWPGAERLKAVS